ncbi:hypothetical protein EYF80_064214 [Liparis tanakae]|uniref:Uncharacterized protein n=1 Tax=Liparis tanakae TaxID=230148 RepID=A0A4Z2EA79_9TELE|nr:hypothetical protein EYF80_064214 [Liparis tanakae]
MESHWTRANGTLHGVSLDEGPRTLHGVSLKLRCYNNSSLVFMGVGSFRFWTLGALGALRAAALEEADGQAVISVNAAAALQAAPVTPSEGGESWRVVLLVSLICCDPCGLKRAQYRTTASFSPLCTSKSHQTGAGALEPGGCLQV